MSDYEILVDELKILYLLIFGIDKTPAHSIQAILLIPIHSIQVILLMLIRLTAKIK